MTHAEWLIRARYEYGLSPLPRRSVVRLCSLTGLFLIAALIAAAALHGIGGEASEGPPISGFATALVDALVWFEFADPATVVSIFLIAALASGALTAAALAFVLRIHAGRGSYWSLPVPVGMIGAAVLFGSFRDLVAYAANAIGLLCPSPDICGAGSGFFSTSGDCVPFAAGFVATAALVLLRRRRSPVSTVLSDR
jgi:hypothetical protein